MADFRRKMGFINGVHRVANSDGEKLNIQIYLGNHIAEGGNIALNSSLEC